MASKVFNQEPTDIQSRLVATGRLCVLVCIPGCYGFFTFQQGYETRLAIQLDQQCMTYRYALDWHTSKRVLPNTYTLKYYTGTRNRKI